MANSIRKDKQGPLWPLGSIIVVTPGTPVRLTSVVDPSNVNAPESATSATSDEYTVRANQIVIQGMKSNAGTGMVNNTGNIYILLKGVGAGTGNRTDTGVLVLTVPTGQTAVIAAAPMNRNVFSPYELWVDADNGGDAAQVTLIIQ
jgi:hypothetical protein